MQPDPRLPRRLAATSVDQLLRARPGAAAVFLRHRMACVGCAMAPFDTVEDAAAVYGIELAGLLREIERFPVKETPR